LAFQGARTLPLDAGDKDLSLRAPADDVAAAQGRFLTDFERRKPVFGGLAVEVL
jgi:hypothetical protein